MFVYFLGQKSNKWCDLVLFVFVRSISRSTRKKKSNWIYVPFVWWRKKHKNIKLCRPELNFNFLVLFDFSNPLRCGRFRLFFNSIKMMMSIIMTTSLPADAYKKQRPRQIVEVENTVKVFWNFNPQETVANSISMLLCKWRKNGQKLSLILFQGCRERTNNMLLSLSSMSSNQTLQKI